jgi:hypothetical protein
MSCFDPFGPAAVIDGMMRQSARSKPIGHDAALRIHQEVNSDSDCRQAAACGSQFARLADRPRKVNCWTMSVPRRATAPPVRRAHRSPSPLRVRGIEIAAWSVDDEEARSRDTYGRATQKRTKKEGSPGHRARFPNNHPSFVRIARKCGRLGSKANRQTGPLRSHPSAC